MHVVDKNNTSILLELSRKLYIPLFHAWVHGERDDLVAVDVNVTKAIELEIESDWRACLAAHGHVFVYRPRTT